MYYEPTQNILFTGRDYLFLLKNYKTRVLHAELSNYDFLQLIARYYIDQLGIYPYWYFKLKKSYGEFPGKQVVQYMVEGKILVKVRVRNVFSVIFRMLSKSRKAPVTIIRQSAGKGENPKESLVCCAAEEGRGDGTTADVLSASGPVDWQTSEYPCFSGHRAHR